MDKYEVKIYERIKEMIKQDYEGRMNASTMVWNDPIPQLVLYGTIDTEVWNENTRRD